MENTRYPRTIGRNATRKIAGIKASVVKCNSFTLAGYFIATEIDAAWAWKELDRFDFARLTEDAPGRYRVRVHSNCWYELFTADYQAAGTAS